MNLVFHDAEVSSPNLTFTFRVHKPPPFFFVPAKPQYPLPVSSEPSYSRKRARPLADIDGLETDLREYSKKRRLRLKLITSRLSKPFAVPPTNILERGNYPQGCIWAKTRVVVVKNALRKAAILNRFKNDYMAAKETQLKQIEIHRRLFRERLAAGAKSSLDLSNVIELRNRAQLQQLLARKSRGVQSRTTQNISSAVRKDPYYIPSYLRPPSPPNEEDIEAERRRRGMGLMIGCDVR